ncbi:hypothetical protein HN446_01115 [bacterium]|nr:hypothetical protein [bacterium]
MPVSKNQSVPTSAKAIWNGIDFVLDTCCAVWATSKTSWADCATAAPKGLAIIPSDRLVYSNLLPIYFVSF